jgi:hypothetical protein
VTVHSIELVRHGRYAWMNRTERHIPHWSGCRGTGSYARRKVCDRTNEISLTPQKSACGSWEFQLWSHGLQSLLQLRRMPIL